MGRAFILYAENLYEDKGGDYEQDYQPVEKISCGYEGSGVLKFGLFTHMRIGSNKITGVKIEEVEVIKQVEKLIRLDAEKRENNEKDREANRPSPYVDESKYVIYNVGCDTGLIYCEENRPIIELALKKGAKAIPILRGERDETNKYPGQMDSHIDVSYAEKVNDKWVAKGYSYVYEDLYCITKEEFESAKLIIEEKKNAAKKQKEEALAAAFVKAKETGEPVLISKYVVHESESPLVGDGEDDMVDICTYAMPDGTTSEKYFHNY